MQGQGEDDPKEIPNSVGEKTVEEIIPANEIMETNQSSKDQSTDAVVVAKDDTPESNEKIGESLSLDTNILLIGIPEKNKVMIVYGIKTLGILTEVHQSNVKGKRDILIHN